MSNICIAESQKTSMKHGDIFANRISKAPLTSGRLFLLLGIDPHKAFPVLVTIHSVKDITAKRGDLIVTVDAKYERFTTRGTKIPSWNKSFCEGIRQLRSHVTIFSKFARKKNMPGNY